MLAKTGKIAFANQLRGLAVLLVMIGHLLLLFWHAPELVSAAVLAPAPQAEIPWIAHVLASVREINFGALGVSLFFLISGFVIPISLQTRSAGAFGLARLLRIFPTYWAGLAVQVGVLLLVGWVWNAEPDLSLRRVLANALLLFNFAHVRSIDTVNWTLVVEAQFYVLAALGAGFLREGRVSALVGVWLISVIGNLAFGRMGVMLGEAWATRAITLGSYSAALGFMTLGTVFNFHLRGRLSTRALSLLTGLGFALFVLSWAVGPSAAETDLIGVSYGLGLAIFATGYALRDRFRSVALFDGLAAISYPLYLVHAVLGYAVMRHAMAAWGWGYPAALSLALVLILATATALHVSVERWSIAAGRRVS